MKGKKWLTPSAKTRMAIDAAVRIIAGGQSIRAAAELLQVNPNTLKRHRRRYRRLWDLQLDRAKRRSKTHPQPQSQSTSRKPPKRQPIPTPETVAVLETAARLMAGGYSLPGTAQELEIESDTLRRQRSQYRQVFDSAYARALAERQAGPEIVITKPVPHNKVALPRPKTRAKIVKACALFATGADKGEVVRTLNVHRGQIDYWRTKYSDLWETEYGRAMQAALVVVRRQAGTAAVIEDPEGYIRQALACQRWAARSGQELFSKGNEVTLSTFYESYYEPIRLADASPNTRKGYRMMLRNWVVLTGDPPLTEITVDMLAHFRECLKKARGLLPGTTSANNTVRRHLTHIQALLTKAGPAGPRNRDAAELIGRVPWVKPPRMEYRPPRFVEMAELCKVYKAAELMECPKVPNVSPADWWQCLLVVALNTGLRKGALFNLRLDAVEWENQRLNVPPSLSKTGHGQRIHLNRVTLAHLFRIRGPRELIFPWPHGDSYFHRAMHSLQDLAGIPRREHFGLQNIRQTNATLLWEISPGAAQFGMAHTTARTTRNHYVAGDRILTAALDALPQPEAFKDSA